MSIRTSVLAGIAALGLTAATLGGAQAGIVLSDNFNSETQALNYTAFAKWNVTAGSVDLIGGPSFFNFYPGNGNYVDLDGSTSGQNPAGQISSKTNFAAGFYSLTFDLGGSTRGDSNTVRVTLGDYSEDFTLTSGAGLQFQAVAFGTTGGALTFTNLGNSDNLGLILDNVSLSSAVPEPATWAMMLIGFAGLSAASARRAKTRTRFA